MFTILAHGDRIAAIVLDEGLCMEVVSLYSILILELLLT